MSKDVAVDVVCDVVKPAESLVLMLPKPAVGEGKSTLVEVASAGLELLTGQITWTAESGPLVNGLHPGKLPGRFPCTVSSHTEGASGQIREKSSV